MVGHREQDQRIEHVVELRALVGEPVVALVEVVHVRRDTAQQTQAREESRRRVFAAQGLVIPEPPPGELRMRLHHPLLPRALEGAVHVEELRDEGPDREAGPHARELAVARLKVLRVLRLEGGAGRRAEDARPTGRAEQRARLLIGDAGKLVGLRQADGHVHRHRRALGRALDDVVEVGAERELEAVRRWPRLRERHHPAGAATVHARDARALHRRFQPVTRMNQRMMPGHTE
jgi:hypothetical protein